MPSPPSRPRTDGSSLPAALGRAAEADPDGVALAVDRGERLTYAAWERRSDALAAGLQQAVGGGGRVALLFDSVRWTDYAVAHLAVNKVGAAPVPLLAGLGEIELARILGHCQPSAVLASPALAPRSARVPILDPAELELLASTSLPPVRAASAPVEILYASRPLGHAEPRPDGHALLLEDQPVLLHAFPPGTLPAQAALRGCLHVTGAGSVVLAEFDAERMCTLIEANPDRACGLHPATAQALLSSGAARRHDVSRLSRVMLASGRASALLLTALAETFPLARLLLIDLPGVGVALHYDRGHPGALGRACDPAAVWVADESGESLAPGELGHVCGGPLRGYVDDRGFVYLATGRDRRVRNRGAPVPKAEVLGGDLGEGADGERAPALAAIRDTVAAVWSRVLRRDDVPLDADFFELGGDAAAAAALSRLLDDAFGLGVTPSSLLETPTIIGVSHEVARRLRARAISASDGNAVAPVAFSQEGMLWHELFAPGCQNLPGLARRYRGPLDLAALARALDEIVRRHSALRTGFELRRGRLVQVVRPHRSVDLEVRDLGAVPAGERDGMLAGIVAEAGRRPFDLALDPLFVPTLVRLGEQDHVLVIRTHHSVFDDWSVGVFRRQLAKLYGAYVTGEASPLPEPRLQFADFSRRQRAALAGPAGTRELAFWRHELAGAPFTAQLSADDPGAPAGAPQRGGETVPLALGAELRGRLSALARRERGTLFMTMLAAFGVLVYRYTGQEDLVMATVVANRNHTELEGLIGCFTKKVPLRLRLNGDPPFTEVLARARTALLGALGHQDLPFESVVQDVLGPPAAAHGLVPHLPLMFQGVTPSQALVLEGVESAGLDTAATAGRAHFTAGKERPIAELPPLPWGVGLYAATFIILSIDESADELSCVARGAFHAPAVRGLLECFRTLLDSLVDDPERPISELALLDERAARQASELGRGPALPQSADTPLGAFRAHLGRAPDAVAVRSREGCTTFAALENRSEALAARLRRAGAGGGSHVGTVLEASLDLIVAVLGIWKAGAAWVGLDPGDDSERRDRIIGDAALELLISTEGVKSVDATPAGSGLGADGDSGPRGGPDCAMNADDAAVLFYGSGSSATDQGVVLDHRSVLNLVIARRNAADGRRHACWCPGPTDDAFVRRLVGLLAGDTLYISERPLRADPAEALGLLERREIDLIDTTPEELEALLDAGLARDLPDDIDAVVVLGTRGPISPELWRAVRGTKGVSPQVLYGPPECGFAATAAASAARGVGRPLANVSASVLDARGCGVPIGAVGELHVGGPCLARGYASSPERTRRRFVVRDGERVFASGLLARQLADGTVELLGTLGVDCDLRGFRVDPARIEAALAGCPGLRDVEVVLEPDGQGEPALLASAVAEGTAPTLARLRAYVWERLPGYALPARLVLRGAGPRTEEACELREGATELQETSILSSLWAAELGVEGIGPDANYWQVFSFLDALSHAREAGVAVLADDVTRNRTVETLATATSAAAGRRRPSA